MYGGNPKIENAIKIINSIEDGKFPLLLNRIAQFLSNGNTGRPFTPVEETKLETSLEITKAEIETLIDGIIEIFHVSAYLKLKPSLVGEQLEQRLQLNPKKAEIIVQVWAASAKGIIDNLKQKTFFPQLNHISYSISVETASESAAREKCPKAQLQLSLLSTQEMEDINLEFQHDELYELYKKLEQIQGQLDDLREDELIAELLRARPNLGLMEDFPLRTETEKNRRENLRKSFAPILLKHHAGTMPENVQIRRGGADYLPGNAVKRKLNIVSK